MKIALCLAGKIGTSGSKNRDGSSEKIVLDIGYRHYKRHILRKNNIDVFIHCWDTQFESEILSRYQPKAYIFEPQIYWEQPEYIKDSYHRYNNFFSRWYSPKIVMQLKREYEHKYNFQYDCVMLGRFDQAWEIDVIFDNFDMNYFYSGHWCEMFHKNKRMFKGGRGVLYDLMRQKKKIPPLVHKHKGYPHPLGRGILDFWFFSNSEMMDTLCTFSDHVNEYFRPEPGKKLFKKHEVVFPSSHIVVGHHLQETGLLEKLKFVFHLYDDFPMVRRKYLGAKK